MDKKVTSRVAIVALCLLPLVVLGAAGFRLYEKRLNDAATRQMLAAYLLVDRLPASVTGIECEYTANDCEPDNISTTCYASIEPRDFTLLATQAHFRKNEHACPTDFSESHQMGIYVGPSFKINEEHWGGTASAHAAVYPDAAHTQFVAVLSHPSQLICD